MKKILLTLSCFTFFIATNSFAQSSFESKTSYVYGYSDDFDECPELATTFSKTQSLTGIVYHIKLELSTPATNLNSNMKINKESVITFLTKKGKSVSLKIGDINSDEAQEQPVQGQWLKQGNSSYSMVFVLNATREDLAVIASEPFFKIMFPYTNGLTKKHSVIEFSKPALSNSKKTIQERIQEVLSQ